jgi:pilus assembly protein FimV
LIRTFQLGDALNQNALNLGRMTLNGVAAAAILLCSMNAAALGLGRLAVQSAIGEALRAEIEVTSLTSEEASNLKVIVAKPEAYRAAGVDYNPVLPSTQVALQRRADGRTFLKISSDRAIQEPFVDVILELTWSTGRLVREYTLLLDPPTTRFVAPPADVAAEPVLSAAPPALPPPAPVAMQAPAAQVPVAPRRPPVAPRIVNRPPPVAAPFEAPMAGFGVGADQYAVRPGDTLSRIAGRMTKPGVSLDQMLVALYRGNPQAFLDNNMNKLRSGVVLSVPGTEAVKSLSSEEARQFILSQSTDFNSFRQRLAEAAPTAKADASPRQAKGAVQATVDEKKTMSGQTPDKLTLSAGAAKGTPKFTLEEEIISKERERQAAAARAAELSKNLEELKKLASAASASAPAAGPGSLDKGGMGSVPGLAGSVASAVPTLPLPVIDSSDPAPAASEVELAASDPMAVAAATPPASVPAAVPASAPAVAEPSFVDRMLDSSMGLILGGMVTALLAGFGFYRLSQRNRRDSGETSFLESRLQPDSFFGASGGQRIDTRDTSGTSSSMSYSLSQLDAIGDVDPVAEADVYLAYGRDLQAEEILKEAMRGNPDRLAIRTKLLEVYAKRRDTKGFESLATQLFSLTQGGGEDWAKAQEMGMQIDPDNLLYQPGGAPNMAGSGGFSEPLGAASTMPQSVSPSTDDAARGRGRATEPATPDLDLELDLYTASSGPGGRTTVPGALDSTPPSSSRSDLGFKKAAADSAPAPLDFDLASISLDMNTSAKGEANLGQLREDADTGSEEDDGRDPLERKLDLAEEFRQIGDSEGARELLQEVINKATGSLRAKAQSMLSSLS